MFKFHSGGDTFMAGDISSRVPDVVKYPFHEFILLSSNFFAVTHHFQPWYYTV